MITRITISNGHNVRVERNYKRIRVYKNVSADRIYALRLAMSYHGFTNYYYPGGADHQRIVTS